MKQTEIGLIPDDWEVKTLGEVATFLDSKRIPITESERKKGIYPYYGASGIIDYVNNYIFDGDYVLLGEDGANIVDRNSRLAFVVHGKCWINNHAHVLHPNEDMDLDFLSEYLESLDYTSYNTGTAQPKLNREKCNFIPVIKPSLAEQQRIAKTLSDVDALISTTEKLIQKKKNIKQGTMQNLLTGKKRLPGFAKSTEYKQTELGLIPEDWDAITLEEIGSCYTGLSGKTAESFGHGDSRYITFLNVLNNTVINTSLFEKVDVKQSEKQNTVKKGDLFFNTSSETPEEVGICSLLDSSIDGLYLNSFCFGFRIKKTDISGLFMAYYFRSSYGRKLMMLLAQGSTRYNLSKAALLKAKLYIPALSEQTAIANVLSNMDKEIETLNIKLEKYRNIKTAMMQQLLTGKIRLG